MTSIINSQSLEICGVTKNLINCYIFFFEQHNVVLDSEDVLNFSDLVDQLYDCYFDFCIFLQQDFQNNVALSELDRFYNNSMRRELLKDMLILFEKKDQDLCRRFFLQIELYFAFFFNFENFCKNYLADFKVFYNCNYDVRLRRPFFAESPYNYALGASLTFFIPENIAKILQVRFNCDSPDLAT